MSGTEGIEWQKNGRGRDGLFQLIGIHPHGEVNIGLPLKKA